MNTLERIKEIAESRDPQIAELISRFSFYERLRYLCENGNNSDIEYEILRKNIPLDKVITRQELRNYIDTAYKGKTEIKDSNIWRIIRMKGMFEECEVKYKTPISDSNNNHLAKRRAYLRGRRY
jgi:hypothetical protein